jgi:hypothetical protein
MKITDNYVFFWDGIYSQWHISHMIIDGIKYNCGEQYMMYQKALFFGDHEIAQKVLSEKNPRNQKALGRQIVGFDKKKWDEVCMGIVYKGNYAKFTQNPELKKEMLSTGNKIFVEASPEDSIWGIYMDENETGIDDPKNWGGHNLLGWALTLVKHELQ